MMNNHRIAVHEKEVCVAWGDMDALGHVNNVRYFDYFQQARIEWLETLNLDMQQTTGPVVVHIACTFLKPVVYPATLILKSSLHSLGRSSMMMDHDLYQGTQLMAQGTCKIVWVDYEKNKSIRFPEEIRRLLLPTELPAIQNYLFTPDERLQSSCFYLIDWPLSRILLKNNACYPWLILVPRRANIREITELSKSDRYQLMEELYQATHIMQVMFNPHKINTGALGNIVPQLHLHIVGRFHDDLLWPHGIWQENNEEKPYDNQDSLISDWISKLSLVTF